MIHSHQSVLHHLRWNVNHYFIIINQLINLKLLFLHMCNYRFIKDKHMTSGGNQTPNLLILITSNTLPTQPCAPKTDIPVVVVTLEFKGTSLSYCDFKHRNCLGTFKRI